jgi:hypothetical protein
MMDVECDTVPSKKVRFVDDRIEIELDFSEEDRREKWLTMADFRAIRNDIFNALESTTYGNRSLEYEVPEQEETTYRGLEAMMSSCRKESVQHFIQDFLEIQEEMRMAGQSSLHNRSLAGFAEKNTKTARERARLIADQDASEARRVYGELHCQDRQ